MNMRQMFQSLTPALALVLTDQLHRSDYANSGGQTTVQRISESVQFNANIRAGPYLTCGEDDG